MRAVDTNVLVRLIVRDKPKQAAAAEAFISKGAWVSHLVLVETTWVLESLYELDPELIAVTVEMLLNHEHLTVQDADAVEAAVESFRSRPAVSFSDNLIVEIARKTGHMPVGTFDKALAKVDGVQRL
ncbi:MAG: type II toxin-antitoxin system VapC family toxin [Gammaproteobacteria bacterium]